MIKQFFIRVLLILTVVVRPGHFIKQNIITFSCGPIGVDTVDKCVVGILCTGGEIIWMCPENNNMSKPEYVFSFGSGDK